MKIYTIPPDATAAQRAHLLKRIQRALRAALKRVDCIDTSDRQYRSSTACVCAERDVVTTPPGRRE